MFWECGKGSRRRRSWSGFVKKGLNGFLDLYREAWGEVSFENGLEFCRGGRSCLGRYVWSNGLSPRGRALEFSLPLLVAAESRVDIWRWWCGKAGIRPSARSILFKSAACSAADSSFWRMRAPVRRRFPSGAKENVKNEQPTSVEVTNRICHDEFLYRGINTLASPWAYTCI